MNLKKKKLIEIIWYLGNLGPNLAVIIVIRQTFYKILLISKLMLGNKYPYILV